MEQVLTWLTTRDNKCPSCNEMTLWKILNRIIPLNGYLFDKMATLRGWKNNMLFSGGCLANNDACTYFLSNYDVFTLYLAVVCLQTEWGIFYHLSCGSDCDTKKVTPPRRGHNIRWSTCLTTWSSFTDNVSYFELSWNATCFIEQWKVVHMSIQTNACGSRHWNVQNKSEAFIL